jgi:hypothetical protein
MSEKMNRSRRTIEHLLESAHTAAHLLLNLKQAITNSGVAEECGHAADKLSDAIRRVAAHRE